MFSSRKALLMQQSRTIQCMCTPAQLVIPMIGQDWPWVGLQKSGQPKLVLDAQSIYDYIFNMHAGPMFEVNA